MSEKVYLVSDDGIEFFEGHLRDKKETITDVLPTHSSYNPQVPKVKRDYVLLFERTDKKDWFSKKGSCIMSADCKDLPIEEIKCALRP